LVEDGIKGRGNLVPFSARLCPHPCPTTTKSDSPKIEFEWEEVRDYSDSDISFNSKAVLSGRKPAPPPQLNTSINDYLNVYLDNFKNQYI